MVAVHSFRAVIHPCNTDTLDRAHGGQFGRQCTRWMAITSTHFRNTAARRYPPACFTFVTCLLFAVIVTEISMLSNILCYFLQFTNN